jgi:hypothetical protein
VNEIYFLAAIAELIGDNENFLHKDCLGVKNGLGTVAKRFRKDRKSKTKE